MAVRQRRDWTAAEIAVHALQATSISQLTLPEVKTLAARVLRDEGNSSDQAATDPETRRIAAELLARLAASDRR